MKKKIVSVIVTTKNESGVLSRLLDSVVKQTYKAVELIIVDNNSFDESKKIAKKYSRYVFNKGPERSAQRNYGAKKAKGEYYLFLDADMELTPKVISDCVSVFSNSKRVGAIAIPEESIANNFWGRVKSFERSFYNENGDPITDAARFFSKEVFIEAGGYDETITGPEDWDLPETVREKGYKVLRIKSKIYHYEQSHSLASLFKKKMYYGMRAHRYLSKHNIPIFSPKTIYFLRPLFYKNFGRLFKHPILAAGLFIMLMVQLTGGGLGFILGKIKNA
jgi:glycosyltransferase involved in cell wall biosynthesis